MKKTALVFGNCQAAHVQHILRAHEPFSRYFNVLITPAVHVMNANHKAKLIERASSSSLLIHQPVSDVYAPASTSTLLGAKSDSALSISFPVLWFDVYFPDIRSSKIKGSGLPYESTIIRDSHAAGRSVSEATAALIKEDLYSEAATKAALASNISRIEARESDLDVKIAPFITSTFRDVRLFHTNNHPTDTLLFWVIDQMLDRLEIEHLSDPLKKSSEGQLAGYKWFESPSIHRVLGFRFERRSKFYHIDREIDPSEYVEMHYRVYDQAP